MRISVKWLLAGLSVGFITTAMSIHYYNKSGPDLLQKRGRQLAGSGAVDCGRAEVRMDPKSVTQCALAAQEAKKTFRARYDIQGIDSFVAVSIVRAPDGVVYALQYDSDPQGGGGRAHEVVGTTKCPEPVHLWVNPSGRINCFQSGTAGRKSVMSPNLEQY